MPIITSERAGEIRGQLTEKYGATWMHHYHEAIEAEVLANAPLTINNTVSTSVGDLLASCEEGWRHANELEREHQRLNALNAELLAALQGVFNACLLANEDEAIPFELDGDLLDAARAAITKASEPVVQHLPSDDSEGGLL
jgi:hypothetical protein